MLLQILLILRTYPIWNFSCSIWPFVYWNSLNSYFNEQWRHRWNAAECSSTSGSVPITKIKIQFSEAITGPQIRVKNWKLFFIFLNQNICCGYSKELSLWECSFECPALMFKLLGKEIFTILCSNFCFTGPMPKYILIWKVYPVTTDMYTVHHQYLTGACVLDLRLYESEFSPLDKSAYQKINFLISQPKHVLWVLKRTVSMRLFFWAPKTYVKTDG